MNQLPPPWKAVKDPNSGRDYFYNPVTKKTQWERPREEASVVPDQEVASTEDTHPTGENAATPQKQETEAETSKSDKVVAQAREESIATTPQPITPQPKQAEVAAPSPAAIEPTTNSSTTAGAGGLAASGFTAASMSLSRASVGSTTSTVAEIQDEAIADLSRLLTRATRDHAALHDKLASMNKVLDRDLPSAKAEIEELKATKESLTKSVLEAEERLRTEEERAKSLEQKLQVVSEENSQLIRDVDEARVTNGTLKEAFADAEKAKIALEATLGARAGELAAEHQKTVQELQEALDAAGADNTSQIEEIKAAHQVELSQLVKSHEDEINELRSKLAQVQDSASSAQSQNTALQEDFQRKLEEVEAEWKAKLDAAESARTAFSDDLNRQHVEKLNEKDIVIAELEAYREKQLAQFQESMAALQKDHEAALIAKESENDQLTEAFFQQILHCAPDPSVYSEYLAILTQEGITTKVELKRVLGYNDLLDQIRLPLAVKASLREFFDKQQEEDVSNGQLLGELQLLKGILLTSSAQQEQVGLSQHQSPVKREVVEEEVVVVDETIVNTENEENGQEESQRVNMEKEEEEENGSSPSSPVVSSEGAGKAGNNTKRGGKKKRK